VLDVLSKSNSSCRAALASVNRMLSFVRGEQVGAEGGDEGARDRP
jgi:hypothetical protein